MKRCSKCKADKDISEFWKSSKQADGWQSYCKDCSNVRRKQHYIDNKERETELRDQWSSDYRDWYISLKKDIPCRECNMIFHHSAMHWHHRQPAEKLDNVGQLAARKRAKSVVLDEVAKCDLICANCHAALTWNESGHNLEA